MVDILSLTVNLADLDISLNNKLCIKNYKTNGCRACLAVCPQRALSTNKGKRVELDAKKCNSCGLCLSACPTECFSTKPDFTDTLLLRLKKGVPQVFSCSKSKQDKSIKVNCLGVLSEAILSLSAIRTGKVFLAMDSCEDCDMAKKALPVIKRNIEQANYLLELQGTDVRIETADKPLEVETIVDRNQFIKTAASEFFKLGLASLPKSEEKDVLPKNRQLLLAQLKGKTIRKKVKNKLPFFALSITDGLCDLCLKCVEYCPTESLIGDFKKEKLALQFNMGMCVGCNLCSRLCHKNCLSLKQTNYLSVPFKWKTLLKTKTVPCEICGKLIPESDNKICGNCQRKTDFNKKLAALFD